MENVGGSMAFTIMSQLYCEPIAETELKRKMRVDSWKDIMDTLSRLMKKALVKDIHKDSNGPVYSLTKKGKRLLEKKVVKRLDC